MSQPAPAPWLSTPATHADEVVVTTDQNNSQTTPTLVQAANGGQLHELISTVSHDLREPLLSIHGMTTLLYEHLEGQGGAEVQHLLRRITANVDRMTNLVNDVLTLARNDREARLESFNLGLVAAGVIASLSMEFARRNVTLRLPHHWPRVHLSRSEADQVLSNLLGNALRFAAMRSEGREAVVRVAWEEHNGRVVLHVDDSGPGVAPENRAHVFELFWKSNPNEGNGIGLAIVKRIAERRNGHARVEDSDLGGARFTIDLPSASD